MLSYEDTERNHGNSVGIFILKLYSFLIAANLDSSEGPKTSITAVNQKLFEIKERLHLSLAVCLCVLPPLPIVTLVDVGKQHLPPTITIPARKNISNYEK